MKKAKNVWKTIKYNLWTLVGFECFYKIMSLIIFTPLFLNMFKLITRVVGYKYLTLENIGSFLLNPLTIVMLIMLILLLMFYTLFDIATIIIILDVSYQKKKIKITTAMQLSFQKCKNILHVKNIMLAFLVLFLIPFLNIGISTNFITTIKIPEFIMDFIIKNKLLLGIFIGIILILLTILLRWIYAINYFILENVSFKEARKKSTLLSKKRHLKDLLTILLVQLIMTLVYFGVVFLGIFIIILISKIFKNILIKSLSTTIIWIFIAFSFIIFTLLYAPTSYATISVMFYQNKKVRKEKIEFIEEKDDLQKKMITKKIIFFVLVIALVMGTIFTYGLYKGKYNLNIEYTRTLEVTAHRGASVLYPENTMSAFKGAKELGADWIELDVQQTKDGKIIVIHDTNFKRTTGVDKNTWELDYAEIKKLDAGSFFSKKFKDERIPLLEEVIDFAKKNNIKLNIELKPTGHEKDFEKEVVEIIKEKNFNDDCVITSQVYEVLENVKKYSAKVKTVYVMSFAYGEITSLKAADHFSIEAASANKKLVKRVHKEGKELYVWTINSKENINKMIDLNVDNIITDNISLAKEIIYESKTSNVINEYVKLVRQIF